MKDSVMCLIGCIVFLFWNRKSDFCYTSLCVADCCSVSEVPVYAIRFDEK